MSPPHGTDIMLRIVSMIDLPVQFLIRAAFVGEVPDEHDEHHDTQGPYIRCLSSILMFLHDFRCHVARCPAKYFDLPIPKVTLVPFSMQVLNPKSINLIPISPSIIIFSNLISLCAMFLLCKYDNALANCFIMFLHWCSENFWCCCCFMAWLREMPGRYYMMMLRWLLD